MARHEEQDLICDFAETYHILYWRQLPATLAATLAAGLGENSRIARKLSGCTVPPSMMLQAATADAVRLLVWQNTRDGTKGKNAPESFVELLSGNTKTEPKQEEQIFFDTPEEFMAWRATMLGGGQYA